MRLILFLTAVLLFPAVAQSQTTFHVPDDFPTIQSAIDGSATGDTVIVRPGTYMENIDFMGKAIHLKSELGPEVTVIDGKRTGCVVAFISNEGPGSRLDGFTVKNGSGMPVGSKRCGGGIYCKHASPIVENNIISGNVAYYGGGIYIQENSYPTIANNHISNNLTAGLTNKGGGIYCTDSFADITGNTITGNTSFGGGDGGGIYCDFSSPRITSNTISENTAYDFGGGLCCNASSPTIANNIIAGNTSIEECGGGIFCFNSSSPIITNNSIVYNTASDNGGGIRSGSSPMIVNTILWDNDAPAGAEIYDTGNATVAYCNVQGGWPGAGNIDADPLWAGPANVDGHLTFDSPCRNAGYNAAVTELYDFEGDPRIAGGTVDIGADEYYHHLYLTGDPAPGGTVTFKVVGEPGIDPVKIYRGSLRTPPLSTQYGMLHIKKPWPHIWNLGPIPVDGIATTTKTIPSGVSPGSEFYFQAMHGPAGNPDTILTNLLTVTIE